MSETWATSGVDLHLELTGHRVRDGLERALREAVQTGRLQPGARLPSSRTLALDLGVARNTVASAYGQLVAEGWLTALPGSSTRVADRSSSDPAARPPVASQPRPLRYSLRSGTPDLSSFPRTGWLAAARRALASAPYEAFGYPDPRGRVELRTALTDYLARARGVRVTPDRIVIVSGFAEGLAVLSEVLNARGARSLAVEAYGHQAHRELIAAAGLRVQPMPVDHQGAAIDDLGDADAVLMTPAHQYPLGVALAAHRRTLAIEWALDTGGVIIEDDYDGEFRYDRQPIGAMQALGPEQVVYAGTASKGLAPGLRLGWLVLPTDLVDHVVAAKTRADRQSGALDQLTLAEFITAGAYDRHVRRSRLAYRRRRDRLVAALQQHAPAVSITGIAAGLHAVVELPTGQDEDEVVTRAAGLGLALEGLRTYNAIPQVHREALVVGYAAPPDHAYTAALARLCAALVASGGTSRRAAYTDVEA